MNRVKGKVKWFSVPKGYGFITLDDGREAFVHYTAIEGSGFRELLEGEDVELNLVDSELGLKAADLTRCAEQVTSS
ncbi:MAG: cold shock domain-containing protein [Gemmatimonadota bacterium]